MPLAGRGDTTTLVIFSITVGDCEAAWQGHTDCIRYLLGAGADAAVEMTGDNELIGVGPGATALQIATKHGKEECSALLA